VRPVDIHSERYAIARSYMLRLKKEDFSDLRELAKLAATCGISWQKFREEFEYLMAIEPPRLQVDPDKHGFVAGTVE
jgi:6-phosphofructokinase 1